MKGTEKRKYIHAVQLTTSNKSLPGAMCKSPPYWKSKIRGERVGTSYLFFSQPFPEHRMGLEYEEVAGPEGENPHKGQPQL